MALIKKERGRVTYHTREGNRFFSDVVVEELGDGDLRLHLAGLACGAGVGRQDPGKEIPLIFDTWEEWLREAGICNSLAEVDFLEVHAFGAAPKTPSPVSDPEGYVAERQRVREVYAAAYSSYWAQKMPDNGLPARFTVYVEDVPDPKASFEVSATALYQKSLRR